jgi:hypothetical protein
MKMLRVPGVGVFAFDPDAEGSAITPGSAIFATHLQAKIVDRFGKALDEIDLGSGLVTTAGVVYMAADMAGGANDISAFNWHGTGTGTTAAAIGDTALQTPAGPARQSGTQTTPGSTNVYRSVATLAYTGTVAVTEWGLFSAVTTGTMWDHKVFTAINVVNGDSIQFTYDLTITAGG